MSAGRVNVEAAAPIASHASVLFDEDKLRKSFSVAWKKFGVLYGVLNVVVLERRCGLGACVLKRLSAAD